MLSGVLCPGSEDFLCKYSEFTGSFKCCLCQQRKLDSVTQELFPLSSLWCPLDQIRRADNHTIYTILHDSRELNVKPSNVRSAVIIKQNGK